MRRKTGKKKKKIDHDRAAEAGYRHGYDRLRGYVCAEERIWRARGA